jgi:hypothetical protein
MGSGRGLGRHFKTDDVVKVGKLHKLLYALLHAVKMP